jgi:hypothetical protein
VWVLKQDTGTNELLIGQRMEFPMTEKLATYIDRARLNLQDAWTGEDFFGESEQRELTCFKCFIASKIDLFVRAELFPLANWFWRPTGCSVQFMVENRFFRLAQEQNNETHLLIDKDGKFETLLSLSDVDRRFEDQLLVAIGNEIERRLC